MKIVFFGTSEFAARILAFLLNEGIDVAAVVTRPDRQKGRSLHLSPPPVKELLLQQNSDIPIYQPEKASTDDFALELSTFKADLFVVVAYGEILKKNILSIPPLGCINIHASLLPKYRGAAPIQRALMDGVSVTGITIIDMVLKMDAGDMLAKAEVPVGPNMTCSELEDKLIEASCKTLLNVFNAFDHHTIQKTPQDHTAATFADKITPEDLEIKWEKPATALHNQIRAFSPAPGAWCYIQIGSEKKRLKIKRTEVLPDARGDAGTNLFFEPARWVVACGQGALQLLEIQLEGKKTMRAQEFMKGLHSPPAFLF